MLRALAHQGIADAEFSSLLHTDRVIPVAHGITFEELRGESPLLAAHSGLGTEHETLEKIAAEIADSLLPAPHP